MSIRNVLVGLLAVFIGLTVLFGSWYTVDQGERAVVLTNGAYTETAGPGLHFKAPWIQDAVKMSTRQKVIAWTYKGKDDDSRMEAYSRDQQAATLVVTVNYHVPDSEVANVYKTYGTAEAAAERLIITKAPQAIKTVFGQFNAVSVIQDRAEFNIKVSDAVKKIVDGGPLTVDSVQIADISFSPDYEKAIEDRMKAEVAVQKQLQTLAQEKILAQIAVTQAQGRADSATAEADAKAYTIKKQGDAEADAIKARGDALRENPDLIRLTQAERWNGVLPTTMIPGGSVPMLGVK